MQRDRNCLLRAENANMQSGGETREAQRAEETRVLRQKEAANAVLIADLKASAARKVVPTSSTPAPVAMMDTDLFAFETIDEDIPEMLQWHRDNVRCSTVSSFPVLQSRLVSHSFHSFLFLSLIPSTTPPPG